MNYEKKICLNISLYQDYHRLEDLNEFITALADANPDFAQVINIGQSYEGREMLVLAVEKAGPGAASIWLEAGIHAREWISPAVAAFIVRELVRHEERLSQGFPYFPFRYLAKYNL